MLKSQKELGAQFREMHAEGRLFDAGADVLFAPGLRRLEDIATVVRAIDRPLNMMMGLSGISYSVHDLAEIGVRRVSLGASLARRAYAAVRAALAELELAGTFSYASDAMPADQLNRIFAAPSASGGMDTH
jgi:2-methylisocitrate lyase-like PEP mutase family enzyme